MIQPACIRSILRVMRAMIDGPYVGWKPTIEDWNRIKVGSVLYVDKDGFLSPTETNLKFRSHQDYDQDASSHGPRFDRKRYPLGGSMKGADLGAFRQAARMDGPVGYGAFQPGDMPPADFFANHPSFHGDSGLSSSSEFSSPGEKDQAIEVIGSVEGARTTENSSSILPMGLMIYNDLMMDIEGTARFLGQEFQDPVLFVPTLTSAGQYLDQGPELQPPNTMNG